MPQTYDPYVNDLMPQDSSYENPSRSGFFYNILPMNETLDQAIHRWKTLVTSGYLSEATEELNLQWILCSPKASLITLVQVHFITDPVSGDIHPGFSIWSFHLMDFAEKATTWVIFVVYAALIIWYTGLEARGFARTIRVTGVFRV